MDSALLRLQLFVISYVPLTFIFAVQLLPDDGWGLHSVWMPTCFLLLGLTGIAMGLRIRHVSQMVSPSNITVNGIRDEGGNAAAYLATYVFPFVLSDTDRWQTWAAYGIYMVILAVVTMRSDLVIINPTLYLLGRKIVAVDHAARLGTGGPYEATSLLICTNYPHVGDVVRVVRFAGGYIEV